MSRYPKGHTGERKTARFTLAMTPAMFGEVALRAADAGLPMAEYMRRRMMSLPVPRHNRAALVAIHGELNAQGVNLNQLTRVANTTQRLPAIERLREVLDAVEAAIDKVHDL